MNIRLSIITINYNDASGLHRTMESIFHQSFTDFEYIVIDGGSTDESINLLQKFRDFYGGLNLDINPPFQWLSEPDLGIYNAMNKGIIRANGEYCLFVNSGDVLCNENVLINLMSQNLTSDIITGNAFVDKKDKNLQFVKAPEKISFYTFFQNTILHQATLIRTSLFEEMGLYNENLKIVADWEFFIKALFLHQYSYQSVNVNISVFENTGISSLPENFPLILREREGVLKKYFAYFINDYCLLQPHSNFVFLHNIQKKLILFRFFTLTTRMINKIFRIFS